MMIKEAVESVSQEWSLQSAPSLAIWSARQAHWRYRCEVKAGATRIFTSFLTTWLWVLSEWLLFFQGDCKNRSHEFLQSIKRLRETGIQPRQGGASQPQGLSSWWQLRTTPFSQVKAKAHETKPAVKRPWTTIPEVLQHVQDLITELVKDGWRIVYTDGSPKKNQKQQKKTERAGMGYLRQMTIKDPKSSCQGMFRPSTGKPAKGSQLWAAPEALQGFGVPKLAILTDSKYLPQGASGKA